MFYSKPSSLHFIFCLSDAHLRRAVLGASVQLEVIDADGRDDVSFPPGVAGAVGERHLVVALARPQQTQVLTKHNREHTYITMQTRPVKCGVLCSVTAPAEVMQCS